MNTFEIICLLIYWQFAYSYMCHTFVDARDGRFVKVLLILFAGTLGVFLFPLVFAEDVCIFLNKKDNNY